MKWIKYQILQSSVGGESLSIIKKIEYNETNLVIAQNEAIGGNYTIEEDSSQISSDGVLVWSGSSGPSQINKTTEEVKNKIKLANKLIIKIGRPKTEGEGITESFELQKIMSNDDEHRYGISIPYWENYNTYPDFLRQISVTVAKDTQNIMGSGTDGIVLYYRDRTHNLLNNTSSNTSSKYLKEIYVL